MNKEIFYCSLDQFDSSNNIINHWTDNKHDCNIKLEINKPVLPLINFDRFKGSFLSIKDTTTLHVGLGANDLVFEKENFTLNFFLNTNQVKEKSKDRFVLSEIELDEYLMRYYLTKGADQRAKIYVEYGSIQGSSKNLDPAFKSDTEIEINYDYWYNFNLEISNEGIVELNVIHTNSVLSKTESSTEDFGGNHVFSLSEELSKHEIEVDIQLGKIESLVFGEENNNGEFDLSDFYIFKGIDSEELHQYIERGINISSKYTYRTKIGFDIFTLYNDEEYKGIQVFDRKKEKYLLRLLFDNYSFAKRNEDSRITLKLKKGFFKIPDVSSEKLNITEINDEFHVELKIIDSQLEYILPDLKVINVTNMAKMFVQCEMAGITIFENNNPIEVCDYLAVDHLVSITDLSRKSSIPFEVMVLGGQALVCDGETRNSILINLINTSNSDIVFNCDNSLHVRSRLVFKSRFWDQVMKKDAVGNIKIDVQLFDESTNTFTQSSKFNYQYNKSTQEVYIETIEKMTIKPDAIIRLCVSGLTFNKLTTSFPAGIYPFYVKFENLEDYNDGLVALSLDLKSHNPELPIGSIIAFYGEKIPNDWLLCNGSKLDSSLYPELYNILPGGNAQSDKTVPDLRDRFLVGAGNKYKLGTTGGFDTVTLNLSQMPPHKHALRAIVGDDQPFVSRDYGWNMYPKTMGIYGTDREHNYKNGTRGETSFSYENHNSLVQSQGGGESHENRPPYHAVYYIIKAK